MTLPGGMWKHTNLSVIPGISYMSVCLWPSYLMNQALYEVTSRQVFYSGTKSLQCDKKFLGVAITLPPNLPLPCNGWRLQLSFCTVWSCKSAGDLLKPQGDRVTDNFELIHFHKTSTPQWFVRNNDFPSVSLLMHVSPSIIPAPSFPLPFLSSLSFSLRIHSLVETQSPLPPSVSDGNTCSQPSSQCHTQKLFQTLFSCLCLARSPSTGDWTWINHYLAVHST